MSQPAGLFTPRVGQVGGKLTFGSLERVGPLAELGAELTWQYSCPVCMVPEVYRGYTQAQARAAVLPKHRGCFEALNLEAFVEAAPQAAAAPASPEPAPSAKSLPRETPPAAPVASPATLGAPTGSTLSLLADEVTFSPLQQAILEDAANGAGHTTVVARAGTGKTFTLVEAVKRMPQGSRVLVLAFNKNIQAELERKMPKGVEVRTLHSLGAMAIRKAMPTSRTAPGKMKAILRREDFFPARQQASLRAAVTRVVSFARATLLDPSRQIEQLCARASVDPMLFHEPSDLEPSDRLDAPPSTETPDLRAIALRRLAHVTSSALAVAREEASREHDFDDMLWLPHVLGLPLGQWDRVVVDEAQDLSAVQIELLLRTVAPGGRVLVVGDDRQAIYAFRGADAQAFALLTSRLGAKTLPLTITYRCPRTVVELAREVVEDFSAAPAAPEGEVRDVKGVQASELQPGDFVLSRTNAPLLRLFFQCVAAGRPAVVQGREGFLDDLIAAVEGALEQAGERASLAEVRRLAMEPFDRAIAALSEREEETSEQVDQRECLKTLFDRSETASQVLDQLKRLNKTDAAAAARAVCLSSVHRAKGLERERVWMLMDTFRPGRSVEEDNLWYVAVTRAKRVLLRVTGVR